MYKTWNDIKLDCRINNWQNQGLSCKRITDEKK